MKINPWYLAIPAAIASAWALTGLFPSTPKKVPIVPTSATNLTAYLSNDFFVAIADLGNYFRSRGAKIIDEDLLEIFLAESGCRAKTPNSIGCLGLNQICPTRRGEPLSGLRAVGFMGTREEYLALPEEKQLVFVRRFYDNTNGGKSYPLIRDVGSLYLCNFSPAFLGKPDNHVMYRAGVDNAYAANRGVDTSNKGFIEVADMAKFVRRTSAGQPAKWNELRSRLALAKQVA